MTGLGSSSTKGKSEHFTIHTNNSTRADFFLLSYNSVTLYLIKHTSFYSCLMLLPFLQGLNADVVSHDKPVKSVCEDGEVLLHILKDEEQQAVKDDLDSMKARYRDVNSGTSGRQVALVEALLLSQQFRDIHKEVVTWLDRCEENFRNLDQESVAELQQERIKVREKCFLISTHFGPRIDSRVHYLERYLKNWK